ncbi:MAG TPA: STAS domain-containing protein [Gemmataceae bacterium]|nr:STAS domain-containing protein [Gemmataceae bacterium]
MSSINHHVPPKVEQSGDVRVITFTDGGIRDVENMLAKELEGCTDGLAGAHLLLDFTNVERLGSVELGTLIGLHKRMKATGGRLTMFNLKPEIYEVFTVTHLQTLLGICREEDAATGGRQPANADDKVDGSAGTRTVNLGDPDKYVESE